MFRISFLVIIMIIVSHLSDDMGSFFAYKDYFTALLLSVLIKPWLANQFD
jgi:hypothetical protein